eukprot:TRINITY_DN4948_c0_g1_i5.p1 TRINITY_DN4948_c0_g1~~TRINITY_DN4948_c0_g1_i5.p1  ORF type:complete len:127 (-),score=17.83 TRINITY_DN4948_c0_g1_i5:423-803(-)
MKAIKRKILIVSGKGGVGKSTMSSQLAMGIAHFGSKVGVLDVDICGPSLPKLFNCEDYQIVSQEWGWIPAISNGVSVMSVAFMLPNRDSPVIWRGPRKTNIIIRFLKDTYWGKLDYLCMISVLRIL